MDLSVLNKQQQQAVTYTQGPLLILAGAGSGKTRVLTYKVAYLIEVLKVPSTSILAITFTNKAATEMRERVYQLIGQQQKQIQISTFHAFGYRVLRENYKALKIKPNFIIFDEAERLVIIKKILQQFNLDSNYYNPNTIKKMISNIKNQTLDLVNNMKRYNSEWEQIVFKVYQKYEEMLSKNNGVDFDDLLLKPIILFKEQPEILKIYQERFRYILIDEYQDTNAAQYTLIKMLSAKYKNIYVVGDIDQCIYSFRGANYNNILNFEKDYPHAQAIMLEKNYRSTRMILEAANNVIKHNYQRRDKRLIATHSLGSKIKYYRAKDETDESYYLINEIEALSKMGVAYHEIAILYRTNAQSRVLEKTFMFANIPYQVVGSYNFYQRQEIKDLMAYLKLIYNENDNISFLRCVNMPSRGIGDKKIEQLRTTANGGSLYEAIINEPELSFKRLIEELKIINQEKGLFELVEAVLTKSGLRAYYQSQNNLTAKIRLENMEELKSSIRDTSHRNELSLEEFLTQISLVACAENKETSDKVSLMTTHATKGLEFKAVFIIGLEEGLFPHANAYDVDVEEERRLFYVALTRAKEHLYLSNAKLRLIFGNYCRNLPSRFIDEIGINYLEVVND